MINTAILQEVAAECRAQVEKWGVQNHPILDPVLLNREGGCTQERMAEHYEIPSELRAKSMLDIALKHGQLTYFHILLEEVSEVVGCLDCPICQRAELVQVAAVAVAMVDCIDRNSHAAAAINTDSQEKHL